MATEGVDRMRENDEFDKKHPGKRKEQVNALKKRKQEFAKKIKSEASMKKVAHSVSNSRHETGSSDNYRKNFGRG